MIMEVKIERLNDQGLGLCYVENKITFVRDAVVGDILSIHLIKSYKKYNIAKIDKMIYPSPIRKSSFCKYSSTCGGCALANISYQNTLLFKKQKLENIFKKFCNLNIPISMIESDIHLSYRNKITLHIKEGNYGYYQENTHTLISIDTCKLASPLTQAFLKELPKFNIKNGTVILRSNSSEELLLQFLTEDDIKIPSLNKYKIAGILKNNQVLLGNNYFIEKVNHMYFKVSYDAFFQVNINICEKLFSLLLMLAPKGKNVLDLFCGTGTLGLLLAPFSKKVYGIELNQNAVYDCLYNAKMNNINNAYYLCGDANQLINKIKEKIDVVIIDPPRSGMSKEGIPLLKKLKANTIFYVACDPITLARDIALLKEDYTVSKLIGLDMFPFTYHVESLCVLNRR